METPLSLNSVPSSCGNWSKGTTIYILKVRGITQLSIVHSLGARQDMAVSALTWLAAVRSGVAYFEPRTEAALEEKSQGCKNGARAVSQSPTGFPSCNHSRSHELQAAFPNYRGNSLISFNERWKQLKKKKWRYMFVYVKEKVHPVWKNSRKSSRRGYSVHFHKPWAPVSNSNPPSLWKWLSNYTLSKASSCWQNRNIF